MRPRYMTAIRSETCRTSPRSCAITMYVSENSSWSSSSRLTICAWIDTSSADTGSSATISFGRRASARAIPIRWRWPPENWCGKRFACSGDKPTASSSSLTRRRRSRRLPTPWIFSGAPTMFRTRLRGFRLEYGSWKTIWSSRRNGRSARLPSLPMGLPSKTISPSVGSRSRTIVRPSVVLPQPDSPTRPRVSPG